MPYNDLGSAMRERFGCRIQKVSLDAGFTCPNRDGKVGTGGCIYCNARGSGTGAFSSLSVREQLEKGKAALKKRYKAEKFIAYFQSFSNTYGPVETLRRRYEEALDVPEVVGLAVGTRPDCADEEALNLLAELNRRTFVSVEYGLQSAHDRTLELINRGHTFSAFRDAVDRTAAEGSTSASMSSSGSPAKGGARCSRRPKPSPGWTSRQSRFTSYTS